MLLRYLSVLASFVTGVCLLQIQPVLPALLWPLLVALAAPTLVWQAQRWRLAGLIILAATLGFGYADLRANWRLADRLPQNMERQVITARGYVAGLPQTGQFGPRFVFVTQDVLTAGATLPRRLSVQWYGDHPELRSGTRWEFDLSAKRPHGQQNPGGFDVEGWMLQQNLGGSASVKGARPLPGYAWQAAIDRVREGIVDHINAVLGDAPYAGVIAAIAAGDRRGISPEQWQSFARAGINHLIVISGA
ncbi:ComEC/Rec2 family competence protein [Silvimonas sp.]|uniref:ComEC/Rec2 family competence protein n=1 Tax=Silvimonas sp. TaxID=2650811 RepID=UPI002850437C|nr:ComEC/Rec2 family competence protein [Silvimonas sp.]MDR3428007.1 ComEC/Rec2 family competence protein [Silvimonas sp.]